MSAIDAYETETVYYSVLLTTFNSWLKVAIVPLILWVGKAEYKPELFQVDDNQIESFCMRLDMLSLSFRTDNQDV